MMLTLMKKPIPRYITGHLPEDITIMIPGTMTAGHIATAIHGEDMVGMAQDYIWDIPMDGRVILLF